MASDQHQGEGSSREQSVLDTAFSVETHGHVCLTGSRFALEYSVLWDGVGCFSADCLGAVRLCAQA